LQQFDFHEDEKEHYHHEYQDVLNLSEDFFRIEFVQIHFQSMELYSYIDQELDVFVDTIPDNLLPND
jgi:hypothetical protein